ncbi:MAG: hypothetical protein H0U87_00790 [Acidobacteria bacterium]|nr:hypothetical protein [Acidobacteriota bacterium]
MWKTNVKRTILYSSVSLILLTILLFRLDLFYVNISPFNSYRLTKSESILFEDAVSKFWEKVENEKFDGLANELYEDEESKYRDAYIKQDFEKIKENRSRLGKIISWEFFRSASPRITSEWSKNPDEKIYQIEYLTKAENGEFCAWFTWKVKANGEIKLHNLNIDSPVEWRVEERDKQKSVVEKHPNEIIIPYADRYIEIRY